MAWWDDLMRGAQPNVGIRPPWESQGYGSAPGQPQISDPRDQPSYGGPTSTAGMGAARAANFGYPAPSFGGSSAAGLPPTQLPAPTPRAPDTGSLGMTVQPGTQAPAAPAAPAAPRMGLYGSPLPAASANPDDINPMTLLDSPAALAVKALTDRGINPFGGSPLANSFMKRASDLAHVAAFGLAGSTSPVSDLQNTFNEMLTRAMGGQSVFAAAGGGAQNLLQAASEAAKRAAPAAGGGSIGDRILADLLSDPAQAAALIANLQYGGFGDKFASTGQRNLVAQAGLFSQLSPQQTQSFLDALVSGQLPQLLAPRPNVSATAAPALPQ